MWGYMCMCVHEYVEVYMHVGYVYVGGMCVCMDMCMWGMCVCMHMCMWEYVGGMCM